MKIEFTEHSNARRKKAQEIVNEHIFHQDQDNC